MTDLALFDLDSLGALAPTRVVRLFDCGRHEKYREDYAHIDECLHFRCPDCGILGGDRGRVDDVMDFVALHGSPSGYDSGYCLMMRYAWERRAECIACHCWWFRHDGCPNGACRLHVPDGDAVAFNRVTHLGLSPKPTDSSMDGDHG